MIECTLPLGEIVSLVPGCATGVSLVTFQQAAPAGDYVLALLLLVALAYAAWGEMLGRG